MKVIDWISYDEACKLPESVGGMGGFFNWDKKGMRWKDYIERFNDVAKPYLEAIRESVISLNIRKGGNWHQSSSHDGCPLFEDNTSATFSYRAWGDLLAAIWSEHEDKDYDYMHFYMSY